MMGVMHVLLRLQRAVDEAGGQRPFAKLHGLSPTYVNRVLSGQVKPGNGICRALHLRRMVIYCEDSKVKP